MTLTLRPLTLDDAQQIRVWRNADLSPWRTSYLLTEEMQEEWYRNEVCNRHSNSRWWAVDDSRLVGMVGLTHIQWENRLAEVNLIMAPDAWQQGHGAVDLLLEQAFDYLGLAGVCGECYSCSSQRGFWEQTAERYGAYTIHLPRRKWWRGRFEESLHLALSVEVYREMRGKSTCSF